MNSTAFVCYIPGVSIIYVNGKNYLLVNKKTLKISSRSRKQDYAISLKSIYTFLRVVAELELISFTI